MKSQAKSAVLLIVTPAGVRQNKTQRNNVCISSGPKRVHQSQTRKVPMTSNQNHMQRGRRLRKRDSDNSVWHEPNTVISLTQPAPHARDSRIVHQTCYCFTCLLFCYYSRYDTVKPIHTFDGGGVTSIYSVFRNQDCDDGATHGQGLHIYEDSGVLAEFLS